MPRSVHTTAWVRLFTRDERSSCKTESRVREGQVSRAGQGQARSGQGRGREHKSMGGRAD